MNPVAYRIKIGVTGHRNNLPDKDLLISAIRNAIGFEEWKDGKTIKSNSVFSLIVKDSIQQLKKSQSTPVAFSVLSALAEGADRIVAEAVLEIDGSTLEVVLPLSKEDYLKDFETEDSKNEFEKYLSLDPYPVRLRNKNFPDQNHSVNVQENRNQCYLHAGKYIVDHCDVLIAVWNYKENKGAGGTYDIIEYARQIKKPVIIFSCNDSPEIEIIKHQGILFQEWKQLEYFNSHKVKKSFHDEQLIYLYQNYFKALPAFEIGFPDNRLTTFEKFFFPGFIKAESVSQRFKNLYSYTGMAAYLLSLTALLVLLAAYLFNSSMLLAYIGEATLLLLILGLITRANHLRSHQNWLEARALSEKLRVAGYFLLTGVSLKKIFFTGTQKNKNTQSWVNNSAKEILRRFPQLELPPINSTKTSGNCLKAIISFVKSAWIEDQLNYHKNFCSKKRKWNVFFERGGLVLFISAIILAGVHILLLNFFHEIIPVTIEKIMLLLSLSLPVMAATMEGIRKHREYSLNIRRSEQMQVALQELLDDAEFVNTKEEFDSFMMRTAGIMTNENDDWLQRMNEATLEYHA